MSRYDQLQITYSICLWLTRILLYLSIQRRTKDIDQIQDEIAAIESGIKNVSEYLDPEAPGGGQFVCIPCSRYFINNEALVAHEKTKPHKKRVKEVAEPQWNQETADAAAGKSAPIK